MNQDLDERRKEAILDSPNLILRARDGVGGHFRNASKRTYICAGGIVEEPVFSDPLVSGIESVSQLHVTETHPASVAHTVYRSMMGWLSRRMYDLLRFFNEFTQRTE